MATAVTILAPFTHLPLLYHREALDLEQQHEGEGEALHRRSWSTSSVNYGIAMDRSAFFGSQLVVSPCSSSSSSSSPSSPELRQLEQPRSRATLSRKSIAAPLTAVSLQGRKVLMGRRPSYTASSNYTTTSASATRELVIPTDKTIVSSSSCPPSQKVRPSMDVAPSSAGPIASTKSAATFARLQARRLQSSGLATHSALEIGLSMGAVSNAVRIAAENPNMGYTLLLDDSCRSSSSGASLSTDSPESHELRLELEQAKTAITKAGLSHRISLVGGRVIDTLDKLAMDIRKGIKSPFGLVFINMSLLGGSAQVGSSSSTDETFASSSDWRKVVDKALDITIEGGCAIFDNVIIKPAAEQSRRAGVDGEDGAVGEELIRRLRNHTRVENGFKISALGAAGDGSDAHERAFVSVTVH